MAGIWKFRGKMRDSMLVRISQQLHERYGQDLHLFVRRCDQDNKGIVYEFDYKGNSGKEFRESVGKWLQSKFRGLYIGDEGASTIIEIPRS
jgi:hypothetical protein